LLNVAGPGQLPLFLLHTARFSGAGDPVVTAAAAEAA
jgi:hypothetical protein